MKAYYLRLANDEGWCFLGTKLAKPFVEKAASIMELELLDRGDDPLLAFVQTDPDDEYDEVSVSKLHLDTEFGLPTDGWKSYDMRLARLWFHNDLPDVICHMLHADFQGVSDPEILKIRASISPVYYRAIRSCGLPLHAALVERKGIGILLAGAGGVGKSTCCRNIPSHWRALCDDESLAVLDSAGNYIAHPFPTWSDHSRRLSNGTWNVQYGVPLAAVFFLRPADHDKAIPVGQSQAALLVNESANQVFNRVWIYQDIEQGRAFKSKLLDNACRLARSVPAFILDISLTGRFWEEIERVLDGVAGEET